MLGLATSDLPEAADLTANHWYPYVYDQRSTNSCVGQSLAGLVHISERSGYGQPSALFPYYNARRYSTSLVLDRGTYIRDAVKMTARLGCPDERFWTFSTLAIKVNRRPSFQAYMQAHARRGGEYFAILSQGNARVRAIKAALAAGYPVIFGTRVTRAFALGQGADDIYDVPRIPDEDIVGGHAMVAVGYEPSSVDSTLFKVRNSWGQGWGDNGHCYFTEQYMRWAHTRSLWVFRGWPLLSKARTMIYA